MIPQPGRAFPCMRRFTQRDFSTVTVRELEREFD
jgi:hypothetical protein